ncbi:MAG: glutamate-5-semialdehyde dehydrogenase [Desulfovibrionales bacterium]
MDLQETITELARSAKQGAARMARADSAAKDKTLVVLAGLLESRQEEILQANEKDCAVAAQSGMDSAKLERLRLTPEGIASMAAACRHVAAMDDPVGEIDGMKKRPNGLLVGRMRIPLGVVAMIYESRPNVTVDATILCLKAGNGVILRGGSEAFHSNQVLAAIISDALDAAHLPGEAVQIIPTTDRAAVNVMLKLDEYIDVVIPRGGEGLIRAVVAEATMPVLKHYKGVCHIYVDSTVDVDQAVEIIFNAKVQRPGVCNALEGLLVHVDSAEILLPKVARRLSEAGVRFKACERSLGLLGKTAEPAAATDWGTEFLSLTLAVKVVDSMAQAQEYIERYGSNHTESILTTDHGRAMRFLREVDASAVIVNASTRFNDGGEFGLGAEIGISTSKLHAYGPMGINELTSAKFVVLGQGQVRT